MKVGSLFSGIGGFDLGLERAGGFQTAWFCEQDAYCTKVLNKHWPDVPVYPDVTELKGSDVEPVDVLCGGFPCQDISVAGKGAGLAGARSGLWSEYARLIGELRPSYVVVENVSALLARGMGTVLGDLAALGYDAEWDCIPASAVGAPHRRDRVWLVAYTRGAGRRQDAGGAHGNEAADERRATADDHVAGGVGSQRLCAGEREARLADAEGEPVWTGLRAHEPGRVGRGRPSDGGGAAAEWWAVEPDVGRVAHGVPARVDRLRSLGNALVPQIAEWLGHRILAYEAANAVERAA